MNGTFTFYTDPGHGWLRVKRRDLELLGIQKDISPFSFETPGKTVVYLEEDCDAGTFIKAYKERWGGEPEYKYHNEPVRPSRIRNMHPYHNEYYSFT